MFALEIFFCVCVFSLGGAQSILHAFQQAQHALLFLACFKMLVLLLSICSKTAEFQIAELGKKKYQEQFPIKLCCLYFIREIEKNLVV